MNVEMGSAERLRVFIGRIECMEEAKAARMAAIRNIYAEARTQGFDTKAMREVVRLRKMDSADRSEQEAVLALYKRALGLDGAHDKRRGEEEEKEDEC